MKNYDSKKNFNYFFRNEIVDDFINEIFEKTIYYDHDNNTFHVSIVFIKKKSIIKFINKSIQRRSKIDKNLNISLYLFLIYLILRQM